MFLTLLNVSKLQIHGLVTAEAACKQGEVVGIVGPPVETARMNPSSPSFGTAARLEMHSVQSEYRADGVSSAVHFRGAAEIKRLPGTNC